MVELQPFKSTTSFFTCTHTPNTARCSKMHMPLSESAAASSSHHDIYTVTLSNATPRARQHSEIKKRTNPRVLGAFSFFFASLMFYQWPVYAAAARWEQRSSQITLGTGGNAPNVWELCSIFVLFLLSQNLCCN